MCQSPFFKEGEAMDGKQVQTYEIGELDSYLFGQGTHYEIYKKMGAHMVEGGTYFAVWAPNAKAVSVVGEFNEWDKEANPLKKQNEEGIYAVLVPEAAEGMLYKYCIETAEGEFIYKADPFANYAELRPGTASRICDISNLQWSDEKWLDKRSKWIPSESPISIYEVHMGSWKRHAGSEDEGFYSYREFAKEAVKYIQEMGYTHIELIGIAEHPYEGSWGYQVTGYYAPTSRYGTPIDFAYMIDYFHQHDIGVILDWVPAHFPKDAHGLANFDGQALFEYANPMLGEHPEWGTKIFNYGKRKVRNFLIGSALFWLEHMHIDGIRVDAVSSMLYLNYGKENGTWIPNQYGGNENLDAVEFFKHLNSLVKGRNPGIMMIAEEATTWPGVTEEPEKGGLGFTFKWEMGWMHDFLDYMQLETEERKENHHRLTFAMTYAYKEKYVLVLSHDEVVHLKKSMLSKMPGEGTERYANLKAAYAFMMGHPGKKLLFMGQDFGQFREWSEDRELDWFLLEQKEHAYLQRFVGELLALYKKTGAFYEQDTLPGGFEWINADDATRSIYSFVRYSKGAGKNLLVVCNFSSKEYREYRVGVPQKTRYRLLLDSDAARFGGSESVRATEYEAQLQVCDGRESSIGYNLPAYGVAIFEF